MNAAVRLGDKFGVHFEFMVLRPIKVKCFEMPEDLATTILKHHVSQGSNDTWVKLYTWKSKKEVACAKKKIKIRLKSRSGPH